ncbi:winged helix DNA-binding domain-containing protein [Dyadobacter subterraneus]|uniref:AlkZ family DNA glycosylase n=1 Tax=Dyadobacter subterraneus TaxID=2773304 RepID=A0ABR9WDI6_9BACT|nr:winged helix DNA-binding domain-containing protein [Dyadobacter subterraneus]MBE9463021.1 AlkZ family DNA glycosylase [Dyadobacter subterraneus]
MTASEIIHARLVNQQIAQTKFSKPEEIVTHLVAMQAQEYAMAKWAIGLRLQNFFDEDIEKAFNEGRILRTHIMRPTWHFVSPEDIRWMISLTAPRVNAVNAFMYRKCELTPKIFSQCNDIITTNLEGGKYLTRNALKAELEKKIETGDGVRLSCIMMQAELEGIICSGPRDGKQFTYALIEERVAKTKTLSKEEMPAELTKRYFKSRGPAQLEDFVMWSGLTVKDAKVGIDMLPKDFVREEINRKNYIYNPDSAASGKIQSTFLMPDYDEYGMSYKDRSAIFNLPPKILDNPKLNIPYNRMIVVDGQIVGSWKRTIKGKEMDVELEFFKKLNKKQEHAVQIAVKKFCSFAGKNYTEK